MKPRLSLFASLMLAFLMLSQHTKAQTNIAYGVRALSSNTTGTFNTGIGRSALYSNTTGGIILSKGIVPQYDWRLECCIQNTDRHRNSKKD